MLFLLLVVPLTQAFMLPSSPSRASQSFTTTQLPGAHAYPALIHKAPLYARNSGDHDGKDSFDANLLTLDILAVVVASQLVGLVDVLNDASFWEKGGWAQPLPAVPATLGSFVQRVSSGSVCWIISSLWGSNDTWIAIPRLPKVVIGFVLLQFGLAFCVSHITALCVEPLYVARDCYFVTIVIVGFRYFYRWFNGV